MDEVYHANITKGPRHVVAPYYAAAQTPSLSVTAVLVAQIRCSPRAERTAAHAFGYLSAPTPGEHEERGYACRPCPTPEAARGILREYGPSPAIRIPITRERCMFIRRITRATFPNIWAFCANDEVHTRLGLTGTGEMSGSRLCGQFIMASPGFLGRTPRFSFRESPFCCRPDSLRASIITAVLRKATALLRFPRKRESVSSAACPRTRVRGG